MQKKIKKRENKPCDNLKSCHTLSIERNETMTTITHTFHKTTPDNFTPERNQGVTIHEGTRSYWGSFTGRRYQDGSWQVFYKDSCGDNCWRSTNRVVWSIEK
ncbi:hypothetical protein N9955_00675 [bacterium]|nr:hypothetical protein [bacterium]